MRFSIIIPAYNSAEYICKGLDSITKQTFKDYELLVVCDRCKDNTQAIAYGHGAKTTVVDFGNDGLTRSKGLDLAQGEYVLFMDDDDWWICDTMLAELDEKIKEEQEPDIIAFSFFFQHIGLSHPRGLNGAHWIAVWNKCWKRSTIGDTRFPNVFSISDRYFHNDMMAKNPRIVDFDKCFYYYNYLREGSISHLQGNTIEQTKAVLKIGG